MLLAGCVTPPDLASLDTAVTDRQARIPATLAGTTFGRAVSASVAQSPTLGRGDAALQEAEAGLLAQEGAFLPRLSVGLRPGDTGFRISSFASISQLIYDGGASAAGLTAASARVLGGVAGRSEAASRAAMAAVTAWADVATARHLVRAAEASLSALEATVAQIEERAAAGAGSSADTLTARSRLANERAAVVAARSEVARAEAVFIEVFGQTPAIGLDLPPLAPAPPGESPPAPVILQAEAALLAADADLAAAEAARFPSLSLTVSAVPGADAVAGLASEQLLAPSRGRAARVAAAEARVAARRTDLDATRRELASRQRIMAAERAAVSCPSSNDLEQAA
jgi:outer membrane protein, adhesin transport system